MLVSPGRAGRPWLGEPNGNLRPARTRRPNTTPIATSAPATTAPAASATRGTRARSSSRTTSPRCGRRHRRAADGGEGLFRAEGERGTCRVVCFSPRHDLDSRRGWGRRGPRGSSTSGPSSPTSWAETGPGSRSSRTGARPWARRTPTPTARSGRSGDPAGEPSARTRPAGAPRTRRGRPLLSSTWPGSSAGGPRVVGARRVAGHRAVLGGLAVRDADPAARPRRPLGGAGAGRPRRPRRDVDPPRPALRRAVRACRSPTRWAGTARRPAGRDRRRHRRVAAPRATSTRRSSDPRRSASSWSATSCSPAPARPAPEEAAERLRAVDPT